MVTPILFSKPLCEHLLSIYFSDLIVTILIGFVSRCTQGVIRMRKRVTLMVVTVTVLFGICWVSDITAHSIDYYTSHRISKETYLTIHTLILLNTAVNPFAYALLSHNFREKMRGMIYCRCPGSMDSWSPTTRIPPSRRKSSERGKNKVKLTISHNETKVLMEEKVSLYVSVLHKKRQLCVFESVNYNEEYGFFQVSFWNFVRWMLVEDKLFYIDWLHQCM